ncbi:MAG: hypothetical protein WC779_05340 [Candidatus Omnitrophota bacterium]|jgi:hypothetical protein
MENMINLKEYIMSIRFVLILGAVILLFGNDFWSYIKEKNAEDKEKATQARLISIQKTTEDMNEKLILVLKENAIATADWKELDISKGVPATANTAFLLFRSPGGVVTGFVQGEGYDERYPFDTSLNNNLPVTVKITKEKIKYTITAPKGPSVPFEILVAGFRFDR